MSDAKSPTADGYAEAIHETTNALTVVLGWIERARQSGDRQEELAAALDRAASHARATRDELRRLIGAELPEPSPEPAGALAQRAVEDLAVEAERAGVRLSLEADPAVAGAVIARPVAAWRVLTNLILNAIAATPTGKRVTLSLAGDGAGSVRFRVEDEGPGIEPSRRETLFTAAVTTKAGGTGLGLRHARALALASGGSLELCHTTTGACFELCWPTTSGATPTPPRPSLPQAEASLDGMRILLLEDDAAVIELLELSLGARGAVVTTVRTAPELHAALRSGRFDVVLLDLSPLANGDLDSVAAFGREQQPNALLVTISGSVVSPPSRHTLWVRKPFTPAELVESILRARRNMPRTDNA